MAKRKVIEAKPVSVTIMASELEELKATDHEILQLKLAVAEASVALSQADDRLKSATVAFHDKQKSFMSRIEEIAKSYGIETDGSWSLSLQTGEFTK